MTKIEKTFEINARPGKIWSTIAERQEIPRVQTDIVKVEVEPNQLAIPS